MTDKIKRELERRIREDYNGDEHEDEIAQGVCASMLYYINSLERVAVSEDLEEAAEEYNKSMSWRWEAPNYPHKEAFIAGANWQKEQMLKGAMDGDVGYWNITGLSINMKLPKCIEDGDKVKVIIVKEE